MALRSEIVKRIELRQGYISFTLGLAGALLAASVTTGNARVALVLPLLVPFLAIGWVQNDLRIADIARYIRSRFEGQETGLGWETWMQEQRDATAGRTWRLVVLSHGGVLIFLQILSILFGVMASANRGPVDYLLIGVDVAAAAAVAIIMRMGARRR